MNANHIPANHPAHNIIKELIKDLISAYTWEDHPYNPDWYGYIILIEPEDTDRVLDEPWDDCRVDIPQNIRAHARTPSLNFSTFFRRIRARSRP
jgi:hypothetical protein